LSGKVDQWRHKRVTVEAMVLMAVEEARGSTLVSNRDLIQGLEVEAEAVTTTLGAE
jgi:hypothetical protein